MQALETGKVASGIKDVEKYHGKWPFTRVLGFQEFFSSLFSLANLAAHVHCMYRFTVHLQSTRQRGTYPQAWLWYTYSSLSINAWLWSAVFHTRDTSTTERLDYLSAAAVVMFSTAAATICTLRLQPAPQALVLLVTVATYLWHCHYMLLVKFDYGYNVVLCIIIGVVGAVMWLVYCFAVRHPGRGVVVAFMCLVHGAMLFEVLDFPPLLGLVDAHCVWHLLTVPLVYLWYQFVFLDVDHHATRKEL